MKKIDIKRLEWVPARTSDGGVEFGGFWRLLADFEKQFSFLALECGIRDVNGNLVGEFDLTISPDGQPQVPGGGWDQFRNEETHEWYYGLKVNAANRLQIHATGSPEANGPFTVTMRTSERVALADPEIDTILEFGMTKAIPESD